MYKILISLFTLFLNSSQMIGQNNTPNIKYLFIGTYTTKGSEGIYVYKFNTKTGDFETVSSTKTINPSFLAIAPNKNYIYSVNETDQLGGISAFSFDKENGQLKFINKVSARGNHPCNIAITKNSKHIAIANYSGGNICIMPINKDGSINDTAQVIQHVGKSTNNQRQDKPHAHAVNFAKKDNHLFVTDLGMDKILRYQFDKKTGLIDTNQTIITNITAGTGPRHLAFHPLKKFVYLIQELSSEITVFKIKKNGLEAVETVSTLPITFKDKNSCADIHLSPDGKFLYGSNRGHNSIAIFKVNKKNGTLNFMETIPVLGLKPRNFIIDPSGNFLLVANQDSDNIVIFKRDKKTGKLFATGNEIKISMPVCLKMM